MRFIAKDLADVADHFDKMAANSAKWAEHASTAKERTAAEVAAFTWNAAAAHLRDTVIQPEAAK